MTDSFRNGQKSRIIRSPVDFQYGSGLATTVQDPPAFDYHAIPVSGAMHKLAFPTSASSKIGLDFFQWLWELRLQQIMTHLPDGLFFSPTIELLSTAVPKIDSTLYRARHNAFGQQFKQVLMALSD